MALNRDMLAQTECVDHADRVVLDMDSSESPRAWTARRQRLQRALRVGLLPPVVSVQRGTGTVSPRSSGRATSTAPTTGTSSCSRRSTANRRQAPAWHSRADAAFAKPAIYEAMEERGVDYAIRVPANASLEWEIADLLFRPPGRPSQKPLVRYKSFHYQAGSWTLPRRVVAKVEHHAGELFPRVGFIVTNLQLPSRAVVRFYNKRGTAEQWIKEGKQAAHWTRLSCHRFRGNEVRLQLSVLAYNLGNLWRRLVLPKRIDHWSLTSVQQRLVKTGGRLVKHARYHWLLLAESHLTRRLFGAMLRRIWALPIPAS